MTLPRFLYKYQAFDEHGWDNVAKSQVWFSKPSDLNDPFDCAIHPAWREIPDDKWALIFQQMRSESPVDVHLLDRSYWDKQRPNQRFKDDYIAENEQGLNKLRDDIRAGRGVACFSETNKDLLMWSHYAQGHTGFCIEFDTTFRLFQKARKVRYSPDIPCVSPMDLILDPDAILDAMVGTKASCWQYEKEWRVLGKVGGCAAILEPNCITGLYLGVNAQAHNRAKAADALRGKSIRVYEMDRSDAKFEVIPRLLDWA